MCVGQNNPMGHSNHKKKVEIKKDFYLILTTARGQFCRAYHSMEYKHICIPSPTNNDVHIKILKAIF
jgi:hypothetical protein